MLTKKMWQNGVKDITILQNKKCIQNLQTISDEPNGMGERLECKELVME